MYIIKNKKQQHENQEKRVLNVEIYTWKSNRRHMNKTTPVCFGDE